MREHLLSENDSCYRNHLCMFNKHTHKSMNKFLQSLRNEGPKRLFFMTRLCFYLILLGGFTTHVSAGAQTKIELNMKSTTLRDVIWELQKQTDLVFVYNTSDVEKISIADISVSQATVKEVLDRCLRGVAMLSYEIADDVVVIRRVARQQPDEQPARKTFKLQGTVIDNEGGKVIAGASVIIQGTTRGVISDTDGRFIIDVAAGDVIEVRFMGKVTQTLTIESDKPVSIVLRNDIIAMDDVVVTGYGNVSRDSYTGNAVTIKRDELLKASKTNVIKALQTFDPSFRIRDNNQWGSDPNALPEVNIRGGSSVGVKQATFNDDGSLGDRLDLSKNNLMNNPNLPTFIMDGFEISVSKLYDFDMNRIESITILKDAAATALYGSRAANGVIVITTVVPKPGELNVSYNIIGEVSFPDLSDYHLLNAAEKLEVERLAGCYIAISGDSWQYDQLTLDKEYNAKLVNVTRGINTYWLSKPLRTVLNHKHSLYIDGGSESLRFGLDVQYYNQDGIMKDSYRDRLGAGFYVQYNYKGLSIRNYTSYLGTNSQESPYGSFATYANQLPYDTYKNDDGSIKPYLYEWSSASRDIGAVRKENPLYEPSLRNFDRTYNHNITNNLILNWNLADGLLWKAQFSLQKENGDSKRFYDPRSMKNSLPLSETTLSSGELYLNYTDGFSYMVNTSVSYFLSANGHNVNALAGFEVSENNNNGHNAFYRGFPSGALSSANYAQEQVGKTRYTDSKSRRMGILASVNYSYNDIYLLDLSVRIDGSSSFGTNKRFAPFGSAGVGVNIHKYKFMENNAVFDQLKIRASYGQVGNARFAPYEALVTYDILNDEWYKTGYGSSLKAYGNPDLKWETTNIFDAGFEITLLKNLIYLRASYYDKKTVDLINDVTIPISTGFTSYKDNIGEVSNRGYEVDFRVAAIRWNDMSLWITGNLAHNKNKILKISESMKEYNQKVQDMYANTNRYQQVVSIPLMQYEEGGSLHSIWGVRSLGINPSDGKEIFLQRDGKIGQVWNTADQIIIGNTEPKGQGSLGFNFSYKRLSLYSSFMYEFGGQRYNQTLVDKVENVNVYKINVDYRVLEGRWKEPGDQAKYKSIAVNRSGGEMTKPTSRFVQDYNILSWNSVELSYDVSPRFTEKHHLSMLRFTAGMNDVLHISSVKQERGISYPFARTVNFSIKLSF